MNLPNFLYIGPDKSGSSWIFEALRLNAQVFVPAAKDLYFFDRYFHLGWKWYSSHFERVSGEIAIGEISHDYLFSSLAAKRIRSGLPSVKLITSVREPVARTFSHYLYLRRSGLTALPFEEAVLQIDELLNKSMYGLHLARYFEMFPREQVRVAQFSDLQRDPLGYLNGLLAFLGVDQVHEDPVGGQVRPASTARSAALARFVKVGAELARDRGMANLVGRVKRNPFVQAALYETFGRGELPALTSEAREFVADRLEKDVERFRAVSGLPCEGWPNREASSSDLVPRCR